jgi:menaquinone-dependent protoporphyrinogen oxidase
MKILAVYGSTYGQAEAVVRRVSGVLARAGHAVALHRADVVPKAMRVEDFDAVVVGASILFGRYQRYVRDFVSAHVAALNARPTAFVSVSGASPEALPAWRAAATGYVAKFLAETLWSPRWSATFSGALRYTRYGSVTRWIMKRISARTGGPTDASRDYEFTDWAAVDRFAAELVDALTREPAAGRGRPREPFRGKSWSGSVGSVAP